MRARQQVSPDASAQLRAQPAPTAAMGIAAGTDAEVLLRRLLPRTYWAADGGAGDRSLEALLRIVAEVYGELRADVARLYEQFFVSTCDARYLPWIGEGIGVEPSQVLDALAPRQWVGWATAFARRKGSLPTLVRAGAAASGWSLYGLDGDEVVARTQLLRAARPFEGRSIDVRSVRDPMALRRPWSRAARTVAIAGRPVRSGTPGGLDALGGGLVAPGSVALSVWRLQSMPVRQRVPGAAHLDGVSTAPGAGAAAVPTTDEASRVDGAGPADLAGRALTFHPFGIDAPLFHVPRTTADVEHLPWPDELPAVLTPEQLRAQLRAASWDLDHRRTSADPASAFAVDVRIWLRPTEDDDISEVPPSRIGVAALDRWASGAGVDLDRYDVLVDPDLGRLLVVGTAPAEVRVDSAYGAVGALGGGPYVAPWQVRPVPRAHVTEVAADGRVGAVASLQDALDAAIAQLARSQVAWVRILDSSTYRPSAGERWTVAVPAGKRVVLLTAPGSVPALAGGFDAQMGDGARIDLLGLLVAEDLRVHGGGTVAVQDCTFAPAARSEHRPSIVVHGGASSVAPSVVVSASIVGPIEVDDHAAGVQLAVRGSVVDAGAGGQALTAVGHGGAVCVADLAGTTVFGQVDADVLVATDCVFDGEVHVVRRDRGLVRCSYVPVGSIVPATVACVPSAAWGTSAMRSGPDGVPWVVRVRDVPQFSAKRYGDPAYARLASASPAEVRTCGGHGGEPGAYGALEAAARETCLATAIEQFLPAGAQASVQYRD